MAWSRPFDDPITLPDGRVLKTLHDAGHYATALPKAVQQRIEWQTAAEMLAAKGERPVMYAHIAMPTGAACGQARTDQAARQEERPIGS